MKTFLTTREVAKLLDVRPGTLTRAVYEGRIHSPVKGPGQAFLWKPAEVEAACWALHRKPLDELAGGKEVHRG